MTETHSYTVPAGVRVMITSRSTAGRQSRAGEIAGAKRAYERAYDVQLTLVSKRYDEAHGFLSLSEFIYHAE